MSADKTCVVIVSGSLERIQMAAMVASVAAVSGHEVLVFLAMNALSPFIKGSNTLVPAEGEMGELMRELTGEKKVPDFRMLFEQGVELGDMKIYPCAMAMGVLGVEQQQLESYVGESSGLAKFLNEARGGQVWTF